MTFAKGASLLQMTREDNEVVYAARQLFCANLEPDSIFEREHTEIVLYIRVDIVFRFTRIEARVSNGMSSAVW